MTDKTKKEDEMLEKLLKLTEQMMEIKKGLFQDEEHSSEEDKDYEEKDRQTYILLNQIKIAIGPYINKIPSVNIVAFYRMAISYAMLGGIKKEGLREIHEEIMNEEFENYAKKKDKLQKIRDILKGE